MARNQQVVRAIQKFVDGWNGLDTFNEIRATSASQNSTPCGTIDRYFGDCNGCALSRDLVPPGDGKKTYRHRALCLCDLISMTETRLYPINHIIKSNWKKIKPMALLLFVVFLEMRRDDESSKAKED